MAIIVVAPTWLEKELNEATDVLIKVYGLEVSIEKIDEDKGRYFIDQKRNQVDGIKMLSYLRILKDANSLSVWLTEYDLYIENLNFCFGLAYGNVAIVSTYRLRDRKKDLYLSRLRKELSHEVGHLFGLRHCNNWRCVMYFSNTLLDTDRKSEDLCSKCRMSLGGVINSVIRR
ncbi:MAG: archaemetzincin family Zn-dependent metalloprotease [Halobacteria archaeon]